MQRPDIEHRDAPRSLASTLSAIQVGRNDPTTRVSANQCWHAANTPVGPGTIRIRWRTDPAPAATAGIDVDGFGDGGAWLVAHVAGLLGDHDRPIDIPHAPPALRAALGRQRTHRFVATRNPYQTLVPIVIGQRITAPQAVRQYHLLVQRYGAPAPAPSGAPPLHTPPEPDVLARVPSWEFHRIGIEGSRAKALINVARHAHRMWTWAASPDAAEVADTEPATARTNAPAAPSFSDRLQRIAGIGPWTANTAARIVLGDTDAVIVGDYHFPHAVVYHLTGRPRGTDAEMLELLEPYAGHRGKVQAALVGLGAAPAFGPRQPMMSITWR